MAISKNENLKNKRETQKAYFIVNECKLSS